MLNNDILGKSLGSLAGLSGPIGVRVVLTILVLIGALVLRRVVVRALRRRFGTAGTGGEGGLSEAGRDDRYTAYRLRKVATYAVWALALLSIVVVWAEFGRQAGFVVGALTAGVAFALQNVLGSFAAWIGILVGKVFRTGDRVMMGGVRGDVIDVSPLRTTIMEIGSPGSEEDSEVWVRARQYTGRVVTISNQAFFEEPIYNYSKDFEYIWEEISIPLTYTTDWEKGRAILLEEVEKATRPFREVSAEALAEMARRYLVQKSEMSPQVFVRLTDNWIELSARFVIPVRSARSLKSAASEEILRRYSEESITIASATSEIVGLPPLRIEGLRELIDAYREPPGSAASPPKNGAEDGEETAR